MFIVMKYECAFERRYTREEILEGKIQDTARAVESYLHKGTEHHHRSLYFRKDL